MSDRFYTVLLTASALLAWIAFFSLIFLTDPVSAGLPGLGIFYGSLTLGFVGLLILARIGLVYFRHKKLIIGRGLYFFYSFLAGIFAALMFYFSRIDFLSPQSAAVTFVAFMLAAFAVRYKLS